MNNIKRRFYEKFNMTDMGELEFFLNVCVTRTKRFIQLDQSVYIKSCWIHLLTSLVHLTRHVSKCPLPSNAVDRIAQDQGELTEQEQIYLDNFPYRSLLGALLSQSIYLSIYQHATRYSVCGGTPLAIRSEAYPPYL